MAFTCVNVVKKTQLRELKVCILVLVNACFGVISIVVVSFCTRLKNDRHW